MNDPSAHTPARGRPRVVVAGGGIAALEAVLALEEVAGDRLDVTLLSSDSRFHYVPLSVAEAFRGGRAYRLDLADLLEPRGVEVVLGTLEGVDAEARRLRTAEGGDMTYDALLVAVGAARRRALPGAVTFSGWKAPAELRELLRRADLGALERVVFAVPGGVTWTLPAYELALMTAVRFDEERIATEIALVTPEPRPLDVFGARASAAVEEMLRSRGVAFHRATPIRIRSGRLVVEGGDDIRADAVVALPELVAPEIEGLPGDDLGFVPIDEHCRVCGAERVYAAGDATSFPLKQGGIATQQADAAVAAIAADLGLAGAPQPFRPMLRGLLLGGGPSRYRRAEVGLTGSTASITERDALDWPQAKVSGRLLAPFLSLHGIPAGAPAGAVTIELATALDTAAAGDAQDEHG